MGLLATQQRAMGAMTSLALLLPVLTRWTSHFLALSRLLHLKRSIRACVDTHYEVLVKSAGKRDMQERARQILGYVHMESFWEGIERVRNDLQPLAIAANILQASSTRLDHVLLTLGNLYRTFSQPCYSDEVREGVHRSLEKRWRKNADQDVFILAVLLNPYIRHHAFRAGNPLLRPASLFALARRVYNRIFQNDVDTGFHTAFWDYLKGSKEFSSANMGLDFWKRAHEEALDNKFAIDVAQIWASVDMGVSTGRNSLVKLAVRILSIIANSADTERVFSNMGFEHTKVRNRLSVQRLRKRIAIKMGLKRLHQSLGLAKGRRRRQVSDLASNLTSTASSSSSLPSTSIPPLADFARHGSTNTLATASQSLALDNLQVPPEEHVADRLAPEERFTFVVGSLIADADEDNDEDVGAEAELIASASTLIHPGDSSSSVVHASLPRMSTVPNMTLPVRSPPPALDIAPAASDSDIPESEAMLLKNIFNPDATNLLQFCWQSGYDSLNAEAAAYEFFAYE